MSTRIQDLVPTNVDKVESAQSTIPSQSKPNLHKHVTIKQARPADEVIASYKMQGPQSIQDDEYDQPSDVEIDDDNYIFKEADIKDGACSSIQTAHNIITPYRNMVEDQPKEQSESSSSDSLVLNQQETVAYSTRTKKLENRVSVIKAHHKPLINTSVVVVPEEPSNQSMNAYFDVDEQLLANHEEVQETEDSDDADYDQKYAEDYEDDEDSASTDPLRKSALIDIPALALEYIDELTANSVASVRVILRELTNSPQRVPASNAPMNGGELLLLSVGNSPSSILYQLNVHQLVWFSCDSADRLILIDRCTKAPVFELVFENEAMAELLKEETAHLQAKLGNSNKNNEYDDDNNLKFRTLQNDNAILRAIELHARDVQQQLDQVKAENERLKRDFHDLQQFHAHTKLTWAPNESIPFCTACHQSFTHSRQRNWCRCCGRQVCGECAKSTRHLLSLGYTNSVTVCKNCCQALDSEFNNVTSASNQIHDHNVDSIGETEAFLEQLWNSAVLLE